ncbi:Mediator of RNA polymerase II transcription subunit 17 [Frankliniella fusca]|uniref:Mediator of RNA polymerase II transcription subunit 17 n=1 Tax=Frankliniella fusca TaxID=407009 RepID=A0AAE1HP50_9NEOP|nr:Mediator of RNA polymerase II transcription subunit 17 [Frankliniella fusca]
MASEQELLQKLGGLIKELDYCCSSNTKETCSDHAVKKHEQWRDIPPPKQRKVPFEIDWQTYPMVTGLPVKETRYKANLLEVANEVPRLNVDYEPRTWLPKPVDLGGDGTPWDLRRYRSRELVGSQIYFGCACPKRNGLQV